MSPVTVLLSVPPDGGAEDLRKLISSAGYAVADHLLGSAPTVDFGPLAAAVIEAGARPELAAAQTRRWRAELGDRVLPVLWVAPPDRAAFALDAGADAVVSRPVDPAVFVAQVRALARSHATAARVAARAAETRLLGDQLKKTLALVERGHELARRVGAKFLPESFPEVGRARFAVCARSRNRTEGDFHQVARLDEDHVGFVVGDVAGGSVGGGLLGVFVQQSVRMKEITRAGYRIIPPNEVLTGVNRALLGLGTDDLPLVALMAGVLNTRTGVITLARAGLPAGVHVPAAGDLKVWAVPGPFLGTADTSYPLMSNTLLPGDRLLIGTDGTRPDGDPGPGGAERLLEAAAHHRETASPEFLDAVANELLQHVRHADDFTLMCVEMLAE